MTKPLNNNPLPNMHKNCTSIYHPSGKTMINFNLDQRSVHYCIGWYTSSDICEHCDVSKKCNTSTKLSRSSQNYVAAEKHLFKKPMTPFCRSWRALLLGIGIVNHSGQPFALSDDSKQSGSGTSESKVLTCIKVVDVSLAAAETLQHSTKPNAPGENEGAGFRDR